MKRNEILGEQKKGVKAVKYNKKPKDHAAEFGKAKEKLAPQKPLEEGAVKELSADLRSMTDEEFQTRYKMSKAEARANLKKKDEGVAEGYRDRRDAYQRDYDSSVSGMGRRQSQAYQDDGGANDERHDLDPSEWYIVKDGKMFKITVYPHQEQEARARGFSPTREQARARADADTRSTDEAMGAEVGKITKVDPATKKATLTKPDGSSMEVDSTALKSTPDGKMSMDTPDADQLKMGTTVVSTEDMGVPPTTDSSSPISGDEENVDLRRLSELAGLRK